MAKTSPITESIIVPVFFISLLHDDMTSRKMVRCTERVTVSWLVRGGLLGKGA